MFAVYALETEQNCKMLDHIVYLLISYWTKEDRHARSQRYFPPLWKHSRTFPRYKKAGIKAVDIVVHDEII